MLRRNSRLSRFLAIAWVTLGAVWLPSESGRAAANVTITPSFDFTDSSCKTPQFSYTITGTLTNDDSGAGEDYFGVVMYDSALRVFDVDGGTFTAAQTQMDVVLHYVLEPALTARPLHVRVFDTLFLPNNADLAAIVAEPLLAEFVHDPALAAPECASVAEGPELQIQSEFDVQAFTSSSTDPVHVDSIQLELPQPARLFVSYSAKCSVADAGSSWLGLEMLLNDTLPIQPTRAALAFCSGTSNARRVGARALGVIDVPTGTHTIDIRGSMQGLFPIGNWTLDDRSLVVMLPEPTGGTLLFSGAVLLGALARLRRSSGRCSMHSVGVLAAGLLCFATTEANAQTRIERSVASYPQNITFALPLSLSPGLIFNASEPERLHISFTAECRVGSNIDSDTYVAIEIEVNGTTISPTSTDYEFCASDGNAIGSWISASVTVVADIEPGQTIVDVLARIRDFDAGENATIDDASLLVVRTPNP